MSNCLSTGIINLNIYIMLQQRSQNAKWHEGRKDKCKLELPGRFNLGVDAELWEMKKTMKKKRWEVTWNILYKPQWNIIK